MGVGSRNPIKRHNGELYYCYRPGSFQIIQASMPAKPSSQDDRGDLAKPTHAMEKIAYCWSGGGLVLVGQKHQEGLFVRIQTWQSTYVKSRLSCPSIDPTHYSSRLSHFHWERNDLLALPLASSCSFYKLYSSSDSRRNS